MRGHRQVEPNNTPHIGVALYSRDTVDNVEVSQDTLDVVDEAVAVFNRNRPSRDIFNVHADNHRHDAALQIELPCDVDPHGPVSQLARAATERYGFAMVASVDTTVSLASNPTTDLAIDRLRDLNKSGMLGFVFIVERAEDRGNESRMTRLGRLQEGIGQLSLPHLTVVTRESAGAVTDLAEVTPPDAPYTSESQELHSDPRRDPGPGMDILG
jgi:hypothetical protein